MENETTRMLADIRERVVRVETKIDSMTDVRSIAEHGKATAIEALQSARSAHHRIDEARTEMQNMKQGQKWLIGTTISVVALFLTAIGLLWKVAGE